MGTSVNQRSPDTASWRAVAAAYVNPIPIPRVVAEIWRAAQHDPSTDWTALLSSSGVAACYEVSRAAVGATEGLQQASRAIAHAHTSSLAADLAKRALAVSLTNPHISFGQALLSQATDYLVSRDLPSYVGPGYRNANAARAVEFKSAVSRQVSAVAADQREPVNFDAWPEYVQGVLSMLVSASEREGRSTR
jgi:hypothetical protein